MNTKFIKIIRTCLLILLSLFLLSCNECEEVPYIDLGQIKICPDYYFYLDRDNSTIDIISSDEDIDRFARQSIADYVAHESIKHPNDFYTKKLQDESNRNRMITEMIECLRDYHVDFTQYSIAAIATPFIRSASISTEEVCSDQINVYMIMEEHTDEHAYAAYLQVPKGNYKLNVKKVWPNKPF